MLRVKRMYESFRQQLMRAGEGVGPTATRSEQTLAREWAIQRLGVNLHSTFTSDKSVLSSNAMENDSKPAIRQSWQDRKGTKSVKAHKSCKEQLSFAGEAGSKANLFVRAAASRPSAGQRCRGIVLDPSGMTFAFLLLRKHEIESKDENFSIRLRTRLYSSFGERVYRLCVCIDKEHNNESAWTKSIHIERNGAAASAAGPVN
ncbi:hypothetical protein EVAR_57975_1 [Eumeta japonica]|uniref:Uncharacterized protein n=1 Tax=Eumeta variegata TaxID=151549 RepID=A0A4C1XVP2_EUMVA|nr:hypothetical protein EVAR_57975_1 [Eumeta japonica]